MAPQIDFTSNAGQSVTKANTPSGKETDGAVRITIDTDKILTTREAAAVTSAVEKAIQTASIPFGGGIVVAAPVNTVAPAITGTPQVGVTLSVSNGTWTGSGITYTYQWRANGNPISLATNNTFVLTNTQLGAIITCVVTAANSGGSVTATSNATSAVIAAAAGAPANTVLPTITGTPQVSSTLSCSTGTWTGTPTSYTYQWRSDGANISGATNSTYVLQSGQLNATITCQVTAFNGFGTSAPAISNSLGPVTAAGALTKVTVILAGQSNAAYMAQRGDRTTAPVRTGAMVLAEQLRTLFGFTVVRALTERAPGVATNYLRVVDDASTAGANDFTVRIICAASGGSPLIEANNSGEAQKPIADTSGAISYKGNYWLNSLVSGSYDTYTENPVFGTYNNIDKANIDGSLTYGPLMRRLMSIIDTEQAAHGSVVAVYWSQGGSDADAVSGIPSSAGYITYNAGLNEIVDDTMERANGVSRVGKAAFYFQQHGRSPVGSDAGYENIRTMQRSITAAKSTYAKLGQEEYPWNFATISRSGTPPTGGATASITIDYWTGDVTNGSTTVTVSSYNVLSGTPTGTPDATTLLSTTGASEVIGAGIQGGTKITASTATTITLSKPATATASNVKIQITDPIHLYPNNTSASTTGSEQTPLNENIGFFAIAKRLARKIAKDQGVTISGGVDGPSVGTPAKISTTVIDIPVIHDGGTDFTIGGSGGWRVEVGGINQTISSVARQNATTIRITLSGAMPDGQIKVWPVYGAIRYDSRPVLTAPSVSDFMYDNNTLPLPLRSTTPVTFTPPLSPLASYYERVSDQGGTTSAGLITAIDTFYSDIASIRDKFDILYLLANETRAGARVNFSQAGTYDLINNNVDLTPGFTPKVGSFGVAGPTAAESGIYSTGFNPSLLTDVQRKYQRTDAFISVYIPSTGTDAIDHAGDNARLRLRARNPTSPSSTTFARINSTGALATFPTSGGDFGGNAPFLFTARRSVVSTVNTVDLYRNATKITTVSNPNIAPDATMLTGLCMLHGHTATGAQTGPIGIFGLGGGLTEADVTTWNTAVQAYITAVTAL